MSHIIALKGKGNSGKTTTIKLVFQILKKKYPKVVPIILIPNTLDIKAIIIINGKKVGIESQGDPSSRLKQSLADFKNNKCDIFICATRTYGMTVNLVNYYAGRNKIDFIKQSYTYKANHTKVNNITALKIISLAGL